MTMEQGRRLGALERRFDAFARDYRADRESLIRAVVRLEESVYRLRCAVGDLERERDAALELARTPAQLALDLEDVAP